MNVRKTILTWSAVVLGILGLVLSFTALYFSQKETQLSRDLEVTKYIHEAFDYLDMKPSGPGELKWEIERGTHVITPTTRKNLEEVRRLIDKIELISPEREELHFLKLMYFIQNGDIFLFEEYLNRQKEIEDKDVLLLIAMTLGNRGGYPEETIKYYEKALSIAPDDSKIRAIFAFYLHSINENILSVTQFELALESSPNDIDIINGLAHVLSESNNMDRAVEILNISIEKEIADADIYNTLGAIYSNKLEYGKAIDSFSMAVKLDMDNPLYHINLSKSYLRVGALDKFLEHKNIVDKLEENVKTEPESVGTSD